MSFESLTLADLEARFEVAKSYDKSQTLAPEEVELILSEIERLIGRLDRMCSSIILRPKGLSPGVIDSLQLMRVISSHTRWHVKHPLMFDNGQTST